MSIGLAIESVSKINVPPERIEPVVYFLIQGNPFKWNHYSKEPIDVFKRYPSYVGTFEGSIRQHYLQNRNVNEII